MYIIYSKDACPGCNQAKALLEAKGKPFEVLMLEQEGKPKLPDTQYYTLAQLQDKVPGVRTVPQIWYYDESGEGPSYPTHYVGGLRSLEVHLAGPDHG